MLLTTFRLVFLSVSPEHLIFTAQVPVLTRHLRVVAAADQVLPHFPSLHEQRATVIGTGDILFIAHHVMLLGDYWHMSLSLCSAGTRTISWGTLP